MIRELFLPTQIRSYYLFTQRIVGIEITKTHVYATVVKAHGNKRTIEQCVQEVIDIDTLISFSERAALALEKIILIVGKYDKVTIAVSSAFAVFKEISVPFSDKEKIKMVVPFEVESLLPFELSQAVIDSIVVNSDSKTQSSEIFVAAVKRTLLQEQGDLFALAGIDPSRVTIDIFELYGLYTSIPEYAQQQVPVLLIYAGDTVTSMLCIAQGTLKGLRIIPKKLSVQDVIFTRDMLSAKLIPGQQFAKILMTGAGAETEEVIAEVSQATGILTEQLHVYKIIHNGIVRVKNTLMISQIYGVSLASALTSSVTQNFNLVQNLVTPAEKKVITVQLITALLLMIMTITIYISNSFWVCHKLNKEIIASEQEAITKLTKELALTPKKGSAKSLEVLLGVARNEIINRENIWSLYSSQNRISFLFYLQELFTRLDRDSLGLILSQLSISEATSVMRLEGEVKDYQALKAFEEILTRSKIFKDFTPSQQTKFDIKILLDKNYRENS